MDSAIDTGTNIVGIRGNRLFVCDRTSGAILSQFDAGNYARTNGCISYDSATSRIFAAAWNAPQWALSGGFQNSVRNLYRFHVSAGSLILDQSLDITSLFGQGANQAAALDCGIMAMDPISAGGNVYCQLATRAHTGIGGSAAIQFSAANPAIFTVGSGGTGPGYNNIVYGSVAGNNSGIMPDPEGGPQVVIQGFSPNSVTTINVAGPKQIVAVGFAPTQQHVLVTDVSQFVYVYSVVGALVATINTLHSAFTGLAVRLDPVDGMLYVPGGNDNTVIQINPATNAFTLFTGFDCPVDYVRAGALRFAVQAGAIPLKSF